LENPDCCDISGKNRLVYRVVPDLTISNPAGSGFGDKSIFGSQNNKPNETNGVSNAVSCYKEAVQFSASFVTTLFASLFFTKFVERQ